MPTRKKAEQLERKVQEAEDSLENMEVAKSEQEYLKEYLYMYKSLKRLTRQAKLASLESGSGRAYYAYCTLLSQQREVIADIRSMNDMSGQVDQLVKDVLQPFSQAVGQAVLNSFYQLRMLAKETTDPKDTKFAMSKIEEITKEISKALQHSYEVAQSQTHKILIGGK